MTNWVRELIAWLLILIGLLVFRTCFGYLNQRQVVEAAVACSIGFIIFRGGLQLLKVCLAVRAVRD